MIPKIESCDGDYDALAEEITNFCSTLYIADYIGTIKLVTSAKKALAKINVENMVSKALKLIEKLS